MRVKPIAARTATVGEAFAYNISIDTFFDVDAGDTLAYSAKLANGNPLPSWLSFDATTRTFNGTPTLDSLGSATLTVIATDGANASAGSTFSLNVERLVLPVVNIVGTDKADTIAGTDGDDNIAGGAGNDNLFGGLGNDIINGGMGIDNLFGGAGQDIFLYNSPTEGLDKINDFELGSDAFSFSRAGFGGDGVFGSDAIGTLDGSRFRLGAAATTASERFIYNNGTLFFDADGVGGKAQVRLAQLVGSPALTSSSFTLF
jgi:Putative Ig domain/RTX calcium-binding nonapeptide repeat (4 copies)